LPFGSDNYWLPRLSPDGRRLAVGIDSDLWVFDLERGGRNRPTFGETRMRFPFTWTPDGRFITFAGPDQRPSAEAVRSSSRATAPTVLPSPRTNRTAPSLNSSENRQPGRRPALRPIVVRSEEQVERHGWSKTRAV
jgi:Tol biopolymer transport system component